MASTRAGRCGSKRLSASKKFRMESPWKLGASLFRGASCETHHVTREQLLLSIPTGLIGVFFLFRAREGGSLAAKTGSRTFGPDAEPTVAEEQSRRVLR